MLKKISIIANLEKERSAKAYKEITTLLRKKHIRVLDNEDISKAQLVITLGGDGMVLRASQIVRPGIPVLSVNLGNLGFLTQMNYAQFKKRLPEILAGKFKKEKRMMLSCRIGSTEYRALNDFVIERTNHRAIAFDVAINKKRFVSYLADGLIISSPTGSTAYSLAAGGPIVEPSVSAIIISPLSPHTLLNRHLIANIDKSIDITANSDVFLTIDGQKKIPVKKGVPIIIRKSKHYFVFTEFKDGKNFFSIIKDKFYRGQYTRV